PLTLSVEIVIRFFKYVGGVWVDEVWGRVFGVVMEDKLSGVLSKCDVWWLGLVGLL
ncbi:3141_t:CDS:2, partial [Acaulospora morrowiae]